MYKLVIIKQFGFEIEMFVEAASARHKIRTLAGGSAKSRPNIVALFLYDDRDEIIMATNVAVL